MKVIHLWLLAASCTMLPVDTDLPGSQTPLINEVLELPCDGGDPPTGGATAGADLHRVSLSDYPDAKCNDGTDPVLFVREAETPENANRWVFWIQGGGRCTSYDECRARWCGTNSYHAGKMSSTYTHESIEAKGIFDREYEDQFNKFGDANQVYLYFCSSDGWSGQADDVVFEDPLGVGEPFRVHFRGRAIMEATIDTLLNGVSSTNGEQTLPSLADADSVLLTGSSAGSTGLAANLDWIATQLPSTTQVSAVLDARFYPTTDFIDDPTVADYVSAGLVADHELVTGAYNPYLDESCVAAHPSDLHLCSETSHVRLNHLTVPFLQVFDLADERVGVFYVQVHQDLGIEMETADLVERVATWNRAQMSSLADLQTTAEEASTIHTTPGAFSQLCPKHTLL